MRHPAKLIIAFALACSPATAVANSADVLEAMKAATVELRITRQADNVQAIAHALVVDKTGKAITPARALVGARTVQAVLPGVARPVAVQLMGVDPTLGLALVRVDLSNPLTALKVKPAEFADAAPQERARLWLGAVRKGTADLSRSEVDELAAFDDLDRRLNAALNFGSLTNWIEVEGTIGPDHAGQPVFDESGNVVGMSVYTWLRRARSGAVLAGEHLVAVRDMDAPLPISPFQFDQAVADKNVPAITWPRIEVTATESADSLRKSVSAFGENYECPLCRGAGTVQKRVKVGVRKQGGLNYPVYENQDAACERCGGTGMNKPEYLRRGLTVIADGLARLDRNDRNIEDAERAIRTTLSQIGEKHTIALRAMLAADAKALMARGPAQIGQPLLVLGELAPNVEATGFAKPVIGIGIGDRSSDRLRFVIDSARLIDRREADLALAGGVLAGYVGVGGGKLIPVVSHGFVVPLPNPQEEDRSSSRSRD